MTPASSPAMQQATQPRARAATEHVRDSTLISGGARRRAAARLMEEVTTKKIHASHTCRRILLP